jgi:pimeloyl-ACP methyl ester carboxylesterase
MDVRSGYLTVAGGRLYCERAGEGFPVVLIHPGLWDLRIWDAQFEAFAEHHDVIRYDLRGSGRSDRPSAPYSNVADLRALLQELGVGRCALVGCSLGGQLAIDFALEHADLADAIVTVSPGLSGHPWEDPELDSRLIEAQAAVAMGDLERAMEAELAMWAPIDPGSETSQRIRQVAMDNTQVFQIPEGLPTPPPSAVGRLAEVRAATLVIVGDKDVREIHAIADRLVAEVPGALKREIHDADHLVMVRQPDVFNRVVLDFLSFRA